MSNFYKKEKERAKPDRLHFIANLFADGINKKIINSYLQQIQHYVIPPL